MARIELGTVTAPSGALAIIDAGLLGMWSHDREPRLPDGLAPADVTAVANQWVDAQLVGADADRVGRQLDRQQFVYDVPLSHATELAARVEELARAEGLDARLEVCAARVPHRRRASHALDVGHGAGEVSFHGVPAGVIRGIPPGELRVVGERMGDQLRMVSLVVSDGEVATSERFARAGVDHARLMFIDLDALGAWEHDRPIDGLADVAFWGREAAAVAQQTAAGELEPGVFGWRDLPVDAAVERGVAVERLRGQLAFATDFRPHSHHYQLMQQVRASPTESGVVEVGNARACGFMTTWGDGMFELFRDLDADGRLVGVRIELATEQRERQQRRLNTSALVSTTITSGGHPVRFMYREAVDRRDSGWRMYSGTERDEDGLDVVPLHAFADLDPRVDQLLDEPSGSVFERREVADEFYRVTDWTPA